MFEQQSQFRLWSRQDWYVVCCRTVLPPLIEITMRVYQCWGTVSPLCLVSQVMGLVFRGLLQKL